MGGAEYFVPKANVSLQKARRQASLMEEASTSNGGGKDVSATGYRHAGIARVYFHRTSA